MYLCHGPFRCLCGSGKTIKCASLDGGGSWLSRKPLATAIGQLLALYRPSGCTGLHATKKQRKMHDVCWPFQWPWRCADTILHALSNGRGPRLLQKPLVAAIGRVLRPIESIGHAKADCFIVDLLKRGLEASGRRHWASIAADRINRSRKSRLFHR